MGGAGYVGDYPVEQLYRDNRLNMIHEGTAGASIIIDPVKGNHCFEQKIDPAKGIPSFEQKTDPVRGNFCFE
jgi:hypothetical protein